MCAELTAAVDVPVLVMTYYNLAWHFGGTDRRSRGSRKRRPTSGLAGAILPDLPAEEGAEWGAIAASAGLATVFLAAPTSTDERLAAVASAARASSTRPRPSGVTGERQSLSDMAAPLVAPPARAARQAPVCVGVGVSDRRPGCARSPASPTA